MGTHKEKLIDKINDRLRLRENIECVIIIGRKEWAAIGSVTSECEEIGTTMNTILGHRLKVIPIASALEVISIGTFNMMMEINKQELIQGLSRVNTVFAYTR